MFSVRRIIDRLLDNPTLNGIFLALDWAKAFDSIAPDSLIEALERFGIPKEFADMVVAIYADRKFTITDSGRTSSTCKQAFGISQGCPLSPFLFVILMSVLMSDVYDDLWKLHGISLDAPLLINDLLYADDTLLVGNKTQTLEKFMIVIAYLGKQYGLELNWKKVEAMSSKVSDSLRGENDYEIEMKKSILYLGSSISIDGSVTSEVSRRLGMDQQDFKALSKI